MKRGVIRIVSGVVLIALQVLSAIGSKSANASVDGNLGYYIGYYSPTIIGVLLMAFGIRANYIGLETELVLHRNSKKTHTVVKWIGFALSVLLLLGNLYSIITDGPGFDIFTLLNLLGMLALSVYSLFYMYKKPSCLFSTAMIFVGSAYVYGVVSDIPYYIMYLSDTDYFIPYLYMGILPRLITGILYIVAATILYKEDFSVKVVRVLGWTIFALEVFCNVAAYTILFNDMMSAILLALPDLPFAVVVMLYMSVLNVNTLRDVPMTTEANDTITVNGVKEMPLSEGGWKCECGRVHQKYETSCICGKTKNESKKHVAIEEANDKILFCRKCGEKLIEGSLFCSKCGTEIVKEC